MKVCTKCSTTKPVEAFHVDSRSLDGRSSHCKKCRKFAREKTKDRRNELGKKYYEVNKGRINQNGREHSKTPKGRFSTYKSCAKTRGLTFNLTFKSFILLWQKPCVYCGGNIETVGIDRLVNEIGYEVGNCVSCCAICNSMKKDSTTDDFIAKIKQIYIHLKEDTI